MQQSSKPDSVASVLKVFAVMEALAEQRTMSLGELSQRVATSKSTTYRLLQTMVELGYVEQEDEAEKYGLTLKLYNLGAKVLSRHVDLVRVADKPMAALSEETQEAVHLGVIDEQTQTVVYIHKYNSVYNLCLQSPIGKRNPLYSTSLGKALLAWREEGATAAMLKGFAYVKLAPNTITDPDLLAAQLRSIRAQGYSEETEESEPGVRCMAAPVFDHEGKIAAAISLSFPVFRFVEDRKPDYVAALLKAGRLASEGMGYLGSYPVA